MAPHMRPRTSGSSWTNTTYWVELDPEHRAPHAAADFGIKFDPISRVGPLARHTVHRAGPGASAIFAAEKPDIRVGDEPPLQVERIEMEAVIGGYVETRGGEIAARHAPAVDPVPSRAAIHRAHGS